MQSAANLLPRHNSPACWRRLAFDPPSFTAAGIALAVDIFWNTAPTRFRGTYLRTRRPRAALHETSFVKTPEILLAKVHPLSRSSGNRRVDHHNSNPHRLSMENHLHCRPVKAPTKDS